ncbi:MAG TPA: hypothetical protein VEB59_11270 [Gemmatimonadales bacterium]|nr:hypothetical protein [Gemmatimonadales bacterium]
MTDRLVIRQECMVVGVGQPGDTLVLEDTGLELDGQAVLIARFRPALTGPASVQWTPVTNSDPENPQLLWIDGDFLELPREDP